MISASRRQDLHSAHVMLVDLTRHRVALVEEGGVLSLPTVVALDGETVDLVAALGQSASTAGGTARAPWVARLPPLTVLTSLAEVSDKTGDETSTASLYLCEPGPAASLAGLVDAWWSRADEDLSGLPAALAAALRFTLAILEDGDTADGPWSFFNLPGATAAFADILTAVPAATAVATMRDGTADFRPTDLRQVRGWWLSSVWQNDEVVFKVTHPNWPGEPAVTDLLGRSLSEHVEGLVASGTFVAKEHRPTPWMIQRRAKARARGLEVDADLAVTERQRLSLACIETLARIQLAFQGREAELLAAGVAERSIAATRAALPRLWAAPELESLEPAQREALPLLETSILARLDALERFGTAPVLAHGDLHLGNVIETEAGIKIIDWTDAAITWPGVDLLTLLPRKAETERREELIAAYEAAVGERFAPAVRPGLDLADVYHAISYATIEAFLPRSARWELGGTVTFLVKRQLELVMK